MVLLGNMFYKNPFWPKAAGGVGDICRPVYTSFTYIVGMYKCHCRYVCKSPYITWNMYVIQPYMFTSFLVRVVYFSFFACMLCKSNEYLEIGSQPASGRKKEMLWQIKNIHCILFSAILFYENEKIAPPYV